MCGKKGRSGSKTGKMTIEQVKAFKAEMHDGEPLTEKAKRYPVNAGTLGQIRSGRTWANIQPD